MIGVRVLLTKGTTYDWNQDTRKVVKQTNIFGIVLLIVYLAFVVFKSTVLRTGFDIRDPRPLGAIGTGITAGVMLGRVVHTLQGIRLVLRAPSPLTSLLAIRTNLPPDRGSTTAGTPMYDERADPSRSRSCAMTATAAPVSWSAPERL